MVREAKSMKYALTGRQMKEADGRMIREVGIPSQVLMERAALQCVAAMKEEKINLSHPLVVCGSGNNGGDGFAIARLLLEEGYAAEAVLAGNSVSRSEETKTQMSILENMCISIGNSLPDKEYSVIIDAVFGIGLSRNIEGKYAEVIERMNAYKGDKVAVDIPSGICSDTGRVFGCAFRADITVTFAYPKAGQILQPGCEYTGKLLVKPIGICDPRLKDRNDVSYILEPSDVIKRMPARREDSNKGNYGKVLLIAGSRGMSGAAYLSAKAAYVTGAGLVRIYTEESNRQILQQLLPEAVMTAYSDGTQEPFGELANLLEWADVVCLGCGLGKSRTSVELVKKVLSWNEKPCVVDADGLNILAEMGADIWKHIEARPNLYAFTPHMKEMSRLTGYTVLEIKENRMVLLKESVKQWHVVCALKDSRTLVASEKKPTFLNTSGNAAMAKAGSGDVLAGTITGLMAQGLPVRDAVDLGVYLHGLGGDAAKKELGSYCVLAEDIIKGIGKTLKSLEERQK